MQNNLREQRKMKNYIGLNSQIRGAERYTLQDGKGKGMDFLYVRNGLGLTAWISIDRAGDISRLEFEGANIGFTSPCGYVAPTYYDKEGTKFLHCGLLHHLWLNCRRLALRG